MNDIFKDRVSIRKTLCQFCASKFGGDVNTEFDDWYKENIKECLCIASNSDIFCWATVCKDCLNEIIKDFV